MMYLKFIPITFLILFCSCSGGANKEQVMSPSMPGMEISNKTAANTENESVDEKINYVAPQIKEIPDNIAFAASTAVEKKIIKNASIKFQVKDLKASTKNLETLSKKFNAYISTSNQGTEYSSLFNNLTIRVPAAQFEELLTEVEKESIYLEFKNITSEDVTEEYVDTESRIKTKKDVEQRYKEILRQAKSIDEILAVEEKLATIREEIESKEGRLKFLGDNVRYSTITIQLYQKTGEQILPENGFFSRLGNALGDGWDGLLSFLLGLIRIWPFLFIAVFIFFLIRRWRKKRKQ
jgi:hypothetical protein